MWWLDLVRYADTIGYHSDNPMNVSPYRDYVIRAFNAEQAVRPVHHRATRRRPAPERDQVAAGRQRLQPPASNDGGRRGAGEGVRGEVRGRPRAQLRAGVARRHDHVRRVPRPQVRPVHPEGLLLDGRVLRGHPGAGGRRARAGHVDPDDRRAGGRVEAHCGRGRRRACEARRRGEGVRGGGRRVQGRGEVDRPPQGRKGTGNGRDSGRREGDPGEARRQADAGGSDSSGGVRATTRPT